MPKGLTYIKFIIIWEEKKMKKIEVGIINFWKWVFIAISIVAVFAVGVRLYKATSFRNDCTVHIWRAEDAPNAEVASEELSIAITAMEEYGFTKGKVTGIIEEENSIGYCYQTLIKFKNEFESFDVDIESDVYNVELNALQSRLTENRPPYLISLGSMYLVWIYGLILLVWIIILFIFLYVRDSYRKTDTMTLKLPSVRKKTT